MKCNDFGPGTQGHSLRRNPLFFLSLLSLFSFSTAQPTQLIPSNATLQPPREAYVSLLYGDFYVLPVRVMMRSLFVNSPDVASGKRERIVIVTGTTSDDAKEQMRRDGITVLSVPSMDSPYKSDAKFHERFISVMTKLYIFNMTEYQRLTFIDADTLVLRDLSPIFDCGVFCATFINPCYFNSGLMLVTPNTTLFSYMLDRLPNTPSYDGGDQGFLNSLFPNFLNAPIYDAMAEHPPESRPQFSRLPFSWHVDHSAFYPRFGFGFENSDRCGPRREIEWLGPPFMKPWLWWTFALLDMSWTWYSYRRQLPNPYPPNIWVRSNGVLLVVSSYVILFLVWRRFRVGRQPSAIFTRLLPGLCPFPNVNSRLSCLYPVLAGTCIWIITFAISTLAVPNILPPYHAIVVFVHLRAITTLMLLLFSGAVFTLGQHQVRRGKRKSILARNNVQLNGAFKEMLLWSIGDACYLVIWSGILWRIPFQTMGPKIAMTVTAIASQSLVVTTMLAKTSVTWTRWADSLPNDDDT